MLVCPHCGKSLKEGYFTVLRTHVVKVEEENGEPIDGKTVDVYEEEGGRVGSFYEPIYYCDSCGEEFREFITKEEYDEEGDL